MLHNTHFSISCNQVGNQEHNQVGNQAINQENKMLIDSNIIYSKAIELLTRRDLRSDAFLTAFLKTLHSILKSS